MKKPAALVSLSRRQFCEGLAGCVGLAALASCSSNDMTMQHVDARTPDSGTTGGCATGAMDVGMPSTFMTGKPVFITTGNFFVVRDAGGLYALTARCTHEGVTTIVQGSDFYCPRHGAQFDFNGAVVQGPASTPLVHYAMCMLSNGHVGVTTSQTVPAAQRLNA